MAVMKANCLGLVVSDSQTHPVTALPRSRPVVLTNMANQQTHPLLCFTFPSMLKRFSTNLYLSSVFTNLLSKVDKPVVV